MSVELGIGGLSVSGGGGGGGGLSLPIPNNVWLTWLAQDGTTVSDVLKLGSGNQIQIGDPAVTDYVLFNLAHLSSNAGVYFRFNGSDAFIAYYNRIEAGVPILGNSYVAGPYAVHGEATSAMTDADYVEHGATIYHKRVIYPASLTLTADRTVTFPIPANADGYYEKVIDTTQMALGAFSLHISVGSGSIVGVATGAVKTLGFSVDGVKPC